MPGFDGTGPMGMGPMTGGGRGFCGTRVTGFAGTAYGFRQAPYVFPFYRTYGYAPNTAQMSHEQEAEFLKSEAEALKRELETLEIRIKQLSVKTK